VLNKARRDRPVLLLWILLFLFVLRVVGQLVVAIGWGWFLPPMPQWYSGLLPYRYLLPVQIVIIILYAEVCLSFTRGKGFLVAPRRRLGRALLMFGSLYFVGMLVRYAVTMAVYPERRWTGGSIPIFFHLVLSAFILVLGRYHYLSGCESDLLPEWQPGIAECPPTIITSSIAGRSRQESRR
jgi:hypothetical protein